MSSVRLTTSSDFGIRQAYNGFLILFQSSAYVNTTHITETVVDINANSVVTSLTLTACERGRAVPAGSGLTAHTKRLRSARWTAEVSQLMHSCVSLIR